MAALRNKILKDIMNFVQENSHLATPPYAVSNVTDHGDGIMVTVTPQNGKPQNVTIWLNGPVVCFEDEDIHWPIDDPSINLGMVALAVLGNATKLKEVATEAACGRRTLEEVELIRRCADTLKEELSKMCERAVLELHAELKGDPDIQAIKCATSAPVAEIVIYTTCKTKPNKYPKTFRGFNVLVKFSGPIAPLGGS